MEINWSFYIRVNEDGTRFPMMDFFPPKFSMLSHLGFDDFSKSNKIKIVLDEINEALNKKSDYSFASDDWCIVTIMGNKSIVSNGFDEFEMFQIETVFIVTLLKEWSLFIEKYENNQIPGINFTQ